MRPLLPLLLAALTALGCSAATSGDIRKKIILHSWDMRATLPELLRHQKQLEASPIDGISLFIHHRTPDGRKINFSTLMSDQPWSANDVAPLEEPLKTLSSGKLRHNFLFTKFHAAERKSWTDDAFWDGAANNFGVMAALAKRTGIRGLIIDPEDYQKSRQFSHLPSDGAYAQAALLARKRGRRIGDAIAAAYPDAVLLFFWFFSLNPELCSGDTDAESAGSLWVPFANGILDAAPPEMTLVDATENAYRYNAGAGEFPRAAWEIARAGDRLAAPENRSKYRTQLQVGFGIYLDSYVNLPKSPWYMPPLENSRSRRLARNLGEALNVSDEYVWLCGEKHSLIRWSADTRFLPWNYQKPRPGTTWDDELPGFTAALESVRGEPADAERILNRKPENLAPNPDCRESGPEQLPKHWNFWQGKESRGTFFQDCTNGFDDRFSAGVSGSVRGTWLIRIPVTPGKRYAFRLRASGTGRAWVALQWQAQGRRVLETSDRHFPFHFPDAVSWQSVSGVVTVPDGVDTVTIMPGVTQSPEQSNRFDALEFCEMPNPN